jgi:hypothetical protein
MNDVLCPRSNRRYGATARGLVSTACRASRPRSPRRSRRPRAPRRDRRPRVCSAASAGSGASRTGGSAGSLTQPSLAAGSHRGWPPALTRALTPLKHASGRKLAIVGDSGIPAAAAAGEPIRIGNTGRWAIASDASLTSRGWIAAQAGPFVRRTFTSCRNGAVMTERRYVNASLRPQSKEPRWCDAWRILSFDSRSSMRFTPHTWRRSTLIHRR